MGYLLDQMEKIAYFAEEAMMEKLADRKHDKAVEQERRLRNKAGKKANKTVAKSLRQGRLLPEVNQLGLDANELADAAESMTPRNLARDIEKYTGKDTLKSLQNHATNQTFDAQREIDRVRWQAGRRIAKNNREAADRLEAVNSMWRREMKDKDDYIKQIAGYYNDARAKTDAVRAHGANRARKLIDTARNLKDKVRSAENVARTWEREAHDRLGLLEEAWEHGNKLTDDLKNFKNLGRFAGAAKWISGNPKKALGTAILGGGGLLGGAGAVGYALND